MQPQPAIPIPAPPPPPPPFSLSAFTQAASNAARYAPTFRKPTLQLAVLLGSPHRLLPHAHNILCSLSTKGVHGFLQTEVEHPVSGVCTPITPEILPDVVAASRADFLILISDRNVQTGTVQLTHPTKPDFIEIPLASLCYIVLDTWTQRLRTVNNLAHFQALATNPNVVTTAHLDSLLHSISSLPALRRSYDKLARLANITQDWQSMRLPKPFSISHQLQPPTQSQQSTHQSQLLSTPLLSTSPSVPSSFVASTWNGSEHSPSTSSGALPILPNTTNTTATDANQLSPHQNDLSTTASSQPSGNSDTCSPISTQSPPLVHPEEALLIETQRHHPQPSNITSSLETPTKTLHSASTSTTASDEAHPSQPCTIPDKLSHESAEPPTSMGLPSLAPSADVSSHDPENQAAHVHPMTATALHRGLASITRAQLRSQIHNETRISQSEFSFSWLKRSQHLSAKILRHQFLARHLHRSLLEARDSISKMQTSKRPAAYHEPHHLPTEAHRQRLLREIHGLIPRIEELGKRLSRRPKEKRRCRVFRETNPWDAYITQAQHASITRGIQGCNEQTKALSSAGWWRCWACRALNDPDVSSCPVCRTQPCGIAPSLAPDQVSRLSEGLRDAIKNAPVGPLPWIFTPGILPIPPAIAPSFTTGWMPKDRRDNNLIHASLIGEDDTGPLPGRFPPFRNGCHEPPERSIRSQDPFNLTTALSNLQCSDGYHRQGPSPLSRPLEPQPPSAARRSEIPAFPKRKSPSRLDTSAPNGPSVGDVMPRIPKNGLHTDMSRDELILGKNTTGSLISHDLILGGKQFDPLQQSTGIRGSLPSIDPRGSNGMHDMHGPRQPESSNTDESYHEVDFRMTGFTERNYPSRFRPSVSKPMEELALRSYEAKKSTQMFPNEKHSSNSAKSMAPGEYQSGGIASLKDLAAASDAAYGGTGSATKESLRTVSAAITAADDESQKPMVVPRVPNGTYNMF